ncbi:hypothetical protein [Virgibacillus sp. YIM 98842]|uniref:hypothetical protein n=1 Tax=Virgibacillus sp. YIM 98842 TaxID=2663533 RepID=UPI0013DCB08B|nr:hypothetical protein [Virgibacillus sp. YIM 98842]
MMDSFLDLMLGPMRMISDFYFEHQMIFNTIIVGLVLFKIFFGKKRASQQEGSPAFHRK